MVNNSHHLRCRNKIPGPVKPQTTSTVLEAFGERCSTLKGVVSLKCKTDKTTATLQFYISYQSDIPILGRAACVKRIELLAKKFASSKQEMVKVYPTLHWARWYMLNRQSHLWSMDSEIFQCLLMTSWKKHLNIFSIISPITEPTEWVNSLVITEKKNGTLSVCLDLHDLNKAIKRCV